MATSLDLNRTNSERKTPKLNFSKTSFYGRQAEQQQLLTSFHRLIASSKKNKSSPEEDRFDDEPLDSGHDNNGNNSVNNTEVVVIRGKSGTGKTRLVTSFRHEIEQMVEHETAPPCFFVKGKSNEPLSAAATISQTAAVMADPYSSLSDALTDLCNEIILLDDEELNALRTRILKSVGGDAHQYLPLCNVVPALEQILFPPLASSNFFLQRPLPSISPLEQKADATEAQQQQQKKRKQIAALGSKTNEMNRLKFLFQTFIRSVCTDERPLILFMDDLHWADDSTLELLSLLLTDKTMRHLFLLVTIREPDEEEQEEALMMLANVSEESTPPSPTPSRQHKKKRLSHKRRNSSGELSTASSVAKPRNSFSRTSFSRNSFTRSSFTKNRRRVSHNYSHRSEDDTGHDSLSLNSPNRNRAFQLFMNTARRRRLPDYQPLLEFYLGNLSQAEIGALLTDLLELSPEIVAPLAAVLEQKTAGNIFYTKSMLQWLEQRNLLTWSLWEEGEEDDKEAPGTLNSNIPVAEPYYRWTWNCDQIMEQASVSDNFVAVVLSKLEGLDMSHRYVLSRAAQLKSSFTVDTLYGLLQSDDGKSWSKMSSKADLISLLDNLVREGLLECTIVNVKYQFSHDRIQEAAALLVEGYEQNALRFTAGMYLLQLDDAQGGTRSESAASQHRGSLSSSSETRTFLAGVDHLNAINDMKLIQNRLGVAKLVALNLEAAQKSTSVAAFPSAKKYLGKGLGMVQQTGRNNYWWGKHYDLCYQLYVLATDIESTFGSVDLAESYAKEIVNNVKTVEEQLPVQWSIAESLGRREKHWEALKIHRLILRILGFSPKPGNIFSIVVDLIAIKRLFARHTDEEILAFPVITDGRILMALETLSSVITRAYYCGQKLDVLCAAFKICRMMFEYGLSPIGGLTVCQLGSMLLGPLQDETLGRRMSDLCVKIMDSTDSKKLESKLLFLYSGYIEPYLNTPTSALEVCLRGYKAGMHYGDMEFASLNGQSAIVTAFYSGVSIQSIVENIDVLTTMMEQYQIESVEVLLKNYALLPEGLSGSIDDPFYWLPGEEQRLNVIKRVKLEQTVAFEVFYEYAAKCQLSYLLGKYEIADQIYSFLERLEFLDHGLNWSVYSRFYGFLISTARYRQTRRGKYKRRARRKRNAIGAILKTKGQAIHHLMQIMDAEYWATFGGRMAKVEDGFLQAITVANGVRRISHLALANELLGDYFYRTGTKETEAQYYLSACYLQYDTWGARAKTQQLQQKYKDVVIVSANTRARPRHERMEQMSGSMSFDDACKRELVAL